MIVIRDKEYFRKVALFAAKQPARVRQTFKDNLLYLHYYGDSGRRQNKHLSTCTLYKDFAPASFEFYVKMEGHEFGFNGGLIFHGAHDGWGSGEALTFSVCINPTDGWSIHT